MTDLPARSGVYAIKNARNGKVYVGSAVNLRKRQSQHWTDLRRRAHFNLHLQSAWDKDGAGAFTFEVLVLCQPDDLIAAEQLHIDAMRATDRAHGYNKRQRAESNLGHTFSAETRERNAAARRGIKQSPELIRKRFAWRVKGQLTERQRAQIDRLTALKIGRPRPDVKEWASVKFSKFNMADVFKIDARYLAGESTRDIATDLGCSDATISYVLNRKGHFYSSIPFESADTAHLIRARLFAKLRNPVMKARKRGSTCSKHIPSPSEFASSTGSPPG